MISIPTRNINGVCNRFGLNRSCKSLLHWLWISLNYNRRRDEQKGQTVKIGEAADQEEEKKIYKDLTKKTTIRIARQNVSSSSPLPFSFSSSSSSPFSFSSSSPSLFLVLLLLTPSQFPRHCPSGSSNH